jgi:3-oxoacyl-[acyl-carrier protein] reductase
MDLGLRGKRVVITGASKGIGRSIAEAFVAEGAGVAICARTSAPLEATAAALRAAGGTVFAAACDVGDADSLHSFLDAANTALGGVDILINNASGFGTADTDAAWQASFAIDIMAAVRATTKVVPWMEAAGGGSIVHISSISGMEGGSPAPYAAAKAALLSHAKTMAVALAAKNIRVNTVAPGSIEFPGGAWEMVKKGMPAMYEGIRASIPFGRLGRPEEVADIVVFAASPRASWLSGAVLAVDGCQHKGNF